MSVFTQRAVLALDKIETSLRGKSMAWIRSRPEFMRYKMLKRLSLLAEIGGAFDGAGISYCVTGGVAYDAVRGTVTRYHADVDFALLGEHAEAAFAALRASGLDVTSLDVYHAVVACDGLHADLFLWQDVGDGRVRFLKGRVEVLIPREFVTLSEPAELMGVRFRVSTKQYLVSILPFVDGEEDRAFLCALKATMPLTFEEHVGKVEISTRRFELRAPSSNLQ